MEPTNRREFIRKSAIIAATGMVIGSVKDLSGYSLTNGDSGSAPFSLPPLPYTYDALEPHIDKMTMEIHHTKHHQAYVNNLNKAIAEGNLKTGTLEEMMAGISAFPMSVRNNPMPAAKL